MFDRRVRALALAAAFTSTPALAHTHGMTFGLSGHDSTYGVDTVSCHGGGECDASSGDTACYERLPILCIAVDGSNNPGVTTDTYNEWAEGHIATTLPVRGVNLTSIEVADQYCRDAFGEDWRMAEFHDGWGWGFKAFGHVRDDTRYWVYIDDQPANCWD